MNNVPLGRRNGRSPLGGFLCRWRCENLLLFPPICTPGSRSAAISVLHKSFWRGTEGSNPSPSSGESRANLTSSAQILEKARSQWRAWSRVPVPERAVNCAVAV